MLNIIIVIPVILVIFYYGAVKPLYFWKNQGVPQHPIAEAFYLNLFRIFHGDVSGFIKDIYHRFSGSRYCGLYFFYSKTLVLRDPELIEQMLIKDFEHFTDHRPFVSEKCDPLFGRNLFSLKGEEWRHLRPILSPSFTSSKMKSMFILIRDCAGNFVQYFQKKDEELITVEMKDAFTRFANDVIATTAFGIEVDSLKNPDNEFYRLGAKTTDLKNIRKQLRFIANAIAPSLCKLFGITFFEEDVRIFFTNLITETIKERREKGIVRPDMIQLLMEAQKNGEQNKNTVADGKCSEGGKESHSLVLSDEDIVAQALVFFFAGFDSVSTVMCFMAHELALNPDVQEKLVLEIRETSKKCEGTLAYESLVNMKYLDMVVSGERV